MFERVLVPTDFSAFSESAVLAVSSLPGVRRVILLHVMGRSWFGGQKEEAARERLVDEASLFALCGRDVEVALEEDGDITEMILSCARENRVSLIAMGARGRGIISGLLLGSVSTGVLRKARTDVLILPENSPERPILSRILCPVDFSRPSDETVTTLAEIGGVSEVMLLHVIKEAGEYAEEEAAGRLRRYQDMLEKAGITASSFLRYGDPVEEIPGAAADLEASMILLSRFGRSDYIENIQIGRVAAGVTERAGRPVYLRFPVLDLSVETRELEVSEFPLAEKVWTGYHHQKSDSENDRIFGVFVEDRLAGVARCKRHPDGLEVDAVYVSEKFRHRGYAWMAVQALVDTCGGEILYMHSTLELIEFYGKFGFTEIDEMDLPPTIRERFVFAFGNLEGANVSPMMRLIPD